MSHGDVLSLDDSIRCIDFFLRKLVSGKVFERKTEHDRGIGLSSNCMSIEIWTVIHIQKYINNS
jgi:hypothetical protein